MIWINAAAAAIRLCFPLLLPLLPGPLHPGLLISSIRMDSRSRHRRSSATIREEAVPVPLPRRLPSVFPDTAPSSPAGMFLPYASWLRREAPCRSLRRVGLRHAACRCRPGHLRHCDGIQRAAVLPDKSAGRKRHRDSDDQMVKDVVIVLNSFSIFIQGHYPNILLINYHIINKKKGNSTLISKIVRDT